MTNGTHNIPDKPVYTVQPPLMPVGYWILYADAPYRTSFGVYHKPSWLQRWFTTKLLGWTWRDAE